MDPNYSVVLDEGNEPSPDARPNSYLRPQTETHRKADRQARSRGGWSVEKSNPIVAFTHVPMARAVDYPLAGEASYTQRA